MTGAPLPLGADAVVRFEETDERDRPGPRERVLIERPAKGGENVREAGEDVRAGTVVLTAGTQLRPVDLGLLAALDRATVAVHSRPRVGVLSTGNEVVMPGEPARPGQIRDSNGTTLAAMVLEAGGLPVPLGVARDDVAAVRDKLAAARGVDLLLTSGGVSHGEFDVVKEVLAAEGQIDLWQVRIKPGKPMAFGAVGGVPLLGLPGNPVAAYVAFLQFARPAIRKLLGLPASRLPTLHACLTCEHENRGRRRHFVRGIVRPANGSFVVEPTRQQGSGVLSSVAQANCLIVIPEEWDHAPAGAEVEVELLTPFPFDSAI
jgi:molybdopterin molybdotransferase